MVGASSLWRVLGIVTAFTLTHSITLSLAVTRRCARTERRRRAAYRRHDLWVAVENILGETRFNQVAYAMPD